MQLFDLATPDEGQRAPQLATPLGLLASWVEINGEVATPDTVAHQPPAAAWQTPSARIELVAATPRYEGVRFPVDGHHAWVWRVRIERDCNQLRFVTVLDAPAGVRDEPLSATWLLGVRWRDDQVVQAIGTSDLEALLVRSGEGTWLPERYIENYDPTSPGQLPFVERTAAGLRATFAAPRAGECFEHHVAAAWADGARDGAVCDAVEVETTGILAGARALTVGP